MCARQPRPDVAVGEVVQAVIAGHAALERGPPAGCPLWITGNGRQAPVVDGRHPCSRPGQARSSRNIPRPAPLLGPSRWWTVASRSRPRRRPSVCPPGRYGRRRSCRPPAQARRAGRTVGRQARTDQRRRFLSSSGIACLRSRTALSYGVNPSLPLMSVRAPCVSRKRAAATLSAQTASCSGV